MEENSNQFQTSTARPSNNSPSQSPLIADLFGAPRSTAQRFPFPLPFMQSNWCLTRSKKLPRPHYDRARPAKVVHRLNRQNNIIELIGAALDEYDRDLLFAIFALIEVYGRTILGSKARLVITSLDELCAIIGRTARGDYEAIKQSLNRLAHYTRFNVRAEIINGRPQYQWREGVKLLGFERVNHYELEIVRPEWIGELIYKWVNYEVYRKLTARYARGLYLLFEAQDPDKRHLFRTYELHRLLGSREKRQRNFRSLIKHATEEIQKHAPQFQVQCVQDGEWRLTIGAREGAEIEQIEDDFWTKNNARLK